MSSELNKLLCAILSALLIYLLASFLSELLYNTDKKKDIKLSYSLEKIEDRYKDLDQVEVDSELKKLQKLKLTNY